MLKKLLLATIISASLVGCSSTTPPPPAPEPTQAPEPAYTPDPTPAPPPAPVVSNHNSVYFGFNQYDIKDDYTGIVKANSDYLVATPAANIQVQGNTDDIGSVEYNLSLGQKRADAVKKALVAGGANPSQVEAISNGKLKPQYSNDTDASRAQNRRSDIMYTTGQPSGYSQDSNGLPMVDGTVYTGNVPEGVQ